MGWFRKEDEQKIPEKLRGKTAEEIVAATERAEALEAENNRIKAEKVAADAETASTKTTLATMQERMRMLEANQKPATKKDDQEPIDFSIDPEGAVNERIQRATVPVAMAVMQSNSLLCRNTAKQMLDRMRFQGTKISKGALFDKYSGDIDALAKITQVQQLQSPEAWIHLFNMVVGQKMDEILSSSREGKFETMFAEGGAASGDTDHHAPPPDDKPSPEEIRIAKRMGIPIEQYLKNKKEMVAAQ